MRKSLAPAVVALCLAGAATPSFAVEGAIDGVVYGLPEETGFATIGAMAVEPEDLQGAVDGTRKVARPEDPFIVFMSVPRSKAAADRRVKVTLFREPTPPAESFLAIRKARDAATFQNGVAKLDADKFTGLRPDQRSYAVQTGLAFAADVVAGCAFERFDKTERCSIQIPRPNGHMLTVGGPTLTESDPEIMKAEIRDLIMKLLPKEAELFSKGEPVPVPALPNEPTGPLEGAIDGTVYAAPVGSVFRTRDGKLLKSSELQATVDVERKKAGPGKKVTLFTTHPVSAPAMTGRVKLTATELPAPAEDYQEFICGEGMPGEDVTCLDVRKLEGEAMPGLRGYGVRFGLTTADKARVLCFDSVGDRECKVQVSRPGRILLEWSAVGLNESDHAALKERVRALVAAALPREAVGRK